MKFPFLFISGAEIAFIIFILIMVFGADKIPDIARGLGKGIRGINNATNEIKGEVFRSGQDILQEDHEVQRKINEKVSGVNSEIRDVSKSNSDNISQK